MSPRDRRLRGLTALLADPVKLDAVDVASRLWKEIDSPLSRRCLEYAAKRDFDALVRLEVNPADYSDRESYQLDRQAVDLLRKYPFKGFAERCQTAAESAFLRMEERCAETNRVIKLWERGQASLPDPHAESAILAARWKISQVLGNFDCNEFFESCKFGPGVTIGSRATSDYQKLAMNPSVTEEFEPFALAFISEFEGWVSSWTIDGLKPEVSYDVYPGGKFATVPKDAKTDRPIETQPSMNGFAQLGIGQMMRRRLKRVGIDLSDQSRNAELARQGSITGALCTTDLSSASDTISTELVRVLLPDDWFHIMDITRTHRILYKGSVRPLSRFCSMGNGFTFELESLIFWALTKSVCELASHRAVVSVYGDDLIFPSKHFPQVASTLEACGFLVNYKKSHYTGFFRESCGADWWQGYNVRPYFLKKEIKDARTVISLVNGITRSARRVSGHNGTDRRFASPIFRCLRRIPPSLRRAIAFGETETDDFILWRQRRYGARISVSTVNYPIENWFQAKATALYRIWRPSEESLHLRPKSGGTGHIHDYKRDDVTVSLKSQPQDFVRDPEVWRGWL